MSDGLRTDLATSHLVETLVAGLLLLSLGAWLLSQHYYICPPIKKETYRLPGPREPPCKRRPKRNMTALSYSCTTWKLQSHFKSKMNNKRSLTHTHTQTKAAAFLKMDNGLKVNWRAGEFGALIKNCRNYTCCIGDKRSNLLLHS